MIPILQRIMKSDRWHLKRRGGIGGSEWPGILSDQHPDDYKWGCIRRLYYEKRGTKPDSGYVELPSRPALRGNILEPVVAELYKAEMGCKFSRKRPKAKYLYGDTLKPIWWLGNPDRVPILMPSGEMIILEIKTMNQNVWIPFIEDGLSVGYKLQPQHYLGGTGLEVAHVAVLWPDGIDYQVEVVPRDEETLRLMYDAGEWFMRSAIKLDTPPDRPPITEQRCSGCPFGQRCLGREFFEIHDTTTSNISDDDELYQLLSRVHRLKEEQSIKTQEIRIANRVAGKYISHKYGDDVEKLFCRELNVAFKKKVGTRFQREEMLADHQELAVIISEHTKRFPQRNISVTVSTKSRERWKYMSI